MRTLEAKVRTVLERCGYVGRNTLLVVAVSGGSDSVTLLHALLSLREKAGLRLHVAHLNHDFRGEEAEEDARFVASLASQLGLPATVERGDPLAYQKEMKVSSFEEAAREVRYDFLTRVVQDTGASAVALGHIADDLAETVLMHLIRGCGVHGLRSMTELSTWRSRRDGREVALFRPILVGVTKGDTIAYCRNQGISFREDSGNQSMRFTRNRVRHQLLPTLRSYNPRVGDALQRLASSAAMEVDYLDKEVDNAWPGLAKEMDGSVVLDVGRLAKLHPFMQRLVLRRAYQELAGGTRRLEEAHLKGMADFIGGRPGKVMDLPGGLTLSTSYGKLILGTCEEESCPLPRLRAEHELRLPASKGEAKTKISGWRVTTRILPSPEAIPGDPFSACLDARAVGSRLRVRARLPGDRFQPMGMKVDKKLQDFFVDQKVPRAWRDRVPLVVTERGIAWVVGYRVAEWARLTYNSRRVCWAQFSQL